MDVDSELHELFDVAAVRGHHCRIIYKDSLGEHHAVIAVPRERKRVDGVEWFYFLSEAGEDMEVRLDDVVTLEPQA